MKTVTVPKEAKGMRLTDYLNQNGHVHTHPCGGKGTCGKCTVQLLKGRLASLEDPEQTLLPDENGNILACRAVCTEDGAVLAFSLSSGVGLVLEEDASGVVEKNGVYSVALDIGTTTLAAVLVETNSQKVVATASSLNPQSGFGADVMSRIAACETGSLFIMQKVILDEVVRLQQTLLDKAGLPCETEISEMAVAGNPTMLHIFCGVSPEGMGRYPFTPAFLRVKYMTGEALGLSCERVTVLPSASAFIGSDVLGGAFSTNMLECDEPTVLIDIGTNGEMVLCTGKKRGSRLYATSAAAGPAFEGANISCGMGGVSGAVCKIEYLPGDTAPVFYTVNDEKPKGLCGSGLVDFAAYLLRSGQMDETGYIEKENISLIGYHVTASGKRFIKANVVLTDRDIRALQLAKSAIRAALETLIDHAELSVDEIMATYLAGGLGYYIDKNSAVAIGLLPTAFFSSSVSVGNTALAGAVYCLCHKNSVEEMQRIADACCTVELNSTAMFSELYMEHMMFPSDAE